MMFDYLNNPEVDNWEVSIVRRTYNAQNTFTDKIVETTKLPNGTNYMFIPVEFRQVSFPEHYLDGSVKTIQTIKN